MTNTSGFWVFSFQYQLIIGCSSLFGIIVDVEVVVNVRGALEEFTCKGSTDRFDCIVFLEVDISFNSWVLC